VRADAKLSAQGHPPGSVALMMHTASGNTHGGQVRAGEGQRPVLSRSPWRLMASPSLSAQRLGTQGLDPATFRQRRAPPSLER
jgi:hypothetical protein